MNYGITRIINILKNNKVEDSCKFGFLYCLDLIRSHNISPEELIQNLANNSELIGEDKFFEYLAYNINEGSV